MLNAKHVVCCDRNRITHGIMERSVHNWHPELKLTRLMRWFGCVRIEQCRKPSQRAIIRLLFSTQKINVLHAEPSLHVVSFFANASPVQHGALAGVPCFIRKRHADRAHVIVLHQFGSWRTPRDVTPFCNLKQPALIAREPHDALTSLWDDRKHVGQEFLMNRGFIINFNQAGQLFLHARLLLLHWLVESGVLITALNFFNMVYTYVLRFTFYVLPGYHRHCRQKRNRSRCNWTSNWTSNCVVLIVLIVLMRDGGRFVDSVRQKHLN